ncbi:apses transcription factor [Grosmannia clavigera kw1407]|uniref:Transcription factor SWI6 n=1 Tax=Grosmannia clavigera (strain kw1407 / UAMH 11150) TaxID=655863 RepID=F0XIU8_GROCL|nr:apses transcription factor [Grosmannia clavigera kw1407]EFX02113.1 apses transcription factor [Grosmannia clavigera kw1407]
MASSTVTTALHSHRASFSAAAPLSPSPAPPPSQLPPAPSATLPSVTLHAPAATSTSTSTSLLPHPPSSQLGHGAAGHPSFDHVTGNIHMPSASQPAQPSSQQSFVMNQPSSQPNPTLSASAYHPFSESSQPKLEHDDPMKIYSAVYSGTNVYEMDVNGIAVMRRRHDSWLNATQILKVAGVDKGKRTKILEKEIQTGEHEKIQGGYGKYQGTWIGFERGVEVCRQYGVEEILRPLLTYDMGQDGGIAGQGNFNTPTKEQAMAAQRKRMYNASNDNRANGASGTFFRGISNTASNMVGIISKARFDSPGPRNRAAGGQADRSGLARAPSFTRQPSIQADELPNSQQSFASDYGRDSETPVYLSQQQSTQQSVGDGAEPPRKRARMGATSGDSFAFAGSADAYANASAFPGSPTEPNESFIYNQAGLNAHLVASNDGHVPLPPLPFEVSPDAEAKRNTLMSLFMDANGDDHSRHDTLRRMTPGELDMPIDAQSHTALHWAATLSRMPLLRALIASGANPFRVNAVGETALMRACLVTNSHEHSSMPDLLDVLGSTIEVRDAKGRTVLHHIAVTSSVKGRSAASRYYLQCLLEWVVRQGSAPNSQTMQPGMNGSAPSAPAKLGLARFMSEIVNAQDKAGDTALNIAAKIGNRSIISQLLEVCADPNLPNRQGLRPLDFGVGADSVVNATGGEAADGDHSGTVGSSQKSRESSDDIVSSITHLLTETASVFQAEMKAKQQAVEALHSQLRTTSAQLGDARRTLDALQEKVKNQQQARQRVLNLSRARDEEQYRLVDLERAHGRTIAELDSMASWAVEPDASADSADAATLPSAAVMRARIRALHQRTAETRRAEQALKSRSRDIELKFRRLVALATRCSDADVDSHLDGLMRAVESEKGDLEIGRVRRFLGGVEGLVH